MKRTYTIRNTQNGRTTPITNQVTGVVHTRHYYTAELQSCHVRFNKTSIRIGRTHHVTYDQLSQKLKSFTQLNLFHRTDFSTNNIAQINISR